MKRTMAQLADKVLGHGDDGGHADEVKYGTAARPCADEKIAAREGGGSELGFRGGGGRSYPSRGVVDARHELIGRVDGRPEATAMALSLCTSLYILRRRRPWWAWAMLL